MKFLLMMSLFYVFCLVSGQRTLLYSLLGKFFIQSQPSTTIYSCSRSEACCAVACTGNDLCEFFSFSHDDNICMLYEQWWTSNLTTVYNSSWSTYQADWQVIQRRQDGSVDFYRNWTEYERGFGNPESEYWIGLANLHNLIRFGNAILRVDLTDYDGSTAYAVYRTFSISGPEDNYRLNIGGYNGTAGDSLASHNKMQFTTFDRDHDTYGGNCAVRFHGAWWYESCYSSSLNGLYNSARLVDNDGVHWYHWKLDFRNFKRVEMKIKQ